MQEVLTDITMASGGGKVSVMYFSGNLEPDVAVSATAAFWNVVRLQCDSSVTFDVRSNGRLVEASTGTLTGFWSAAGSAPVQGTNGGEPVADATQALVQWRTGAISVGREIRGRTFIPGINAAFIAGGNLGEVSRLAIQVAAQTLADAETTGFGIWSRPREGFSGIFTPTTTASCWSELAVLRRRRG